MVVTKRGNKGMTGSQLSTRISEIFDDKAIGVDMLRSIYLTEYYRNVPQLSAMEGLASAMGHSVEAAFTYYTKHD